MTRNTKGRDRWNGATPQSSDSCNPTPIRSGIKTAIVRLALWGVIPAGLATWLINHTGLKHA
jgi:hypothetical protein